MEVLSKKITLILILFAILPCRSQTVDKKTPFFPFYNPSLSIDKRVEDLISRLTLEEKADQMMNATPEIKRLNIVPNDSWNEALYGARRSVPS